MAYKRAPILFTLNVWTDKPEHSLNANLLMLNDQYLHCLPFIQQILESEKTNGIVQFL